jgi:hypothetical protein
MRPRSFRYPVEHSPWGQAVIRQGTYGFVCHNSTRKLGWSVLCIPILQILGDIWFLDYKEHSKPRTQCVIWSSDSSAGEDASLQKRHLRFREVLQPPSLRSSSPTSPGPKTRKSVKSMPLGSLPVSSDSLWFLIAYFIKLHDTCICHKSAAPAVLV